MLAFDDAKVQEILETPIDDENLYQPSVILTDSAKEILLFAGTSGTTGTSKIIPHSHAQIISQSIAVLPMDRILTFGPIQWISTLLTLLHSTALGGTRIITTKPFAPELQATLIEKFRVTVIVSLTTFVSPFLDWIESSSGDLSSLKRLLCGGNLLFEDVMKRLRRLLPKLEINANIYGMSEALVLVFDPKCDKPGVIGRPFDRLKFKVSNSSNILDCRLF